MDVLCDTNVILTSITGREDPFPDSCDQILRLSASGKIRAWIAFHSLSTIWYVMRKIKGEQETRLIMESICDAFDIATATHVQVVEAIHNPSFRDFEDCLQDECAQAVGAECLITCNIKDFKYSKTKSLTPEAFLALMGHNDSTRPIAK